MPDDLTQGAGPVGLRPERVGQQGEAVQARRPPSPRLALGPGQPTACICALASAKYRRSSANLLPSAKAVPDRLVVVTPVGEGHLGVQHQGRTVGDDLEDQRQVEDDRQVLSERVPLHVRGAGTTSEGQ